MSLCIFLYRNRMIHLSTVSDEIFIPKRRVLLLYTTTKSALMPTAFRVYGQHLLWSRQIIVLFLSSLSDLIVLHHIIFLSNCFSLQQRRAVLGWAFSFQLLKEKYDEREENYKLIKLILRSKRKNCISERLQLLSRLHNPRVNINLDLGESE